MREQEAEMLLVGNSGVILGKATSVDPLSPSYGKNRTICWILTPLMQPPEVLCSVSYGKCCRSVLPESPKDHRSKMMTRHRRNG